MLETKIKSNLSIEKSRSQAAQDLFVLLCLNEKRGGRFLDLGCHHPVNINNTFLLESEYGWTGLSYDVDQSLLDLFPQFRKTKGLNRDCTDPDNNVILSFSDHFDYLSLDLEPASRTLQCLKKLNLDKINFSVITFEHDFYRFGDEIKSESRSILRDHGYLLLCEDVSIKENSFEDWYVNPELIDTSRIVEFKSSFKDYRDILFKEV